MDPNVPKEEIKVEMSSSTITAPTDNFSVKIDATTNNTKLDTESLTSSSIDNSLNEKSPSITENTNDTTESVPKDCTNALSSSQNELYSSQDDSDFKIPNNCICCIEDCDGKGVSGPYLRAPRGLSDKGFVLKKGIPRPVYFCVNHLAAISSKHKRKIPSTQEDTKDLYKNGKIDKLFIEKKSTDKVNDKEQKKTDGIKSRLRTRGRSLKSFNQLIAAKYLEDFEEPTRKKHCMDTRRSKKKSDENDKEFNEKEKEDSSTEDDDEDNVDEKDLENKEIFKDAKMKDEESDTNEEKEVVKEDIDTNENEMVVENDSKEDENEIKSSNLVKYKKDDSEHVIAKEEKDEDEYEREVKPETSTKEETKNQKQQKEKKLAILPDDGYKKYALDYDFTGKTCWRRGCNKPDRLLKLVLPFQVCTCKNHNEKAEGLFIKALSGGKMHVSGKDAKSSDRVCGICGSSLSSSESISCGQSGCPFAFCRSCTESIFLHNNMHSPIDATYESFDEIKEDELEWECWVCQAEKTTKQKRYRETYLNALLGINPQEATAQSSSSLFSSSQSKSTQQQQAQQMLPQSIQELPPALPPSLIVSSPLPLSSPHPSTQSPSPTPQQEESTLNHRKEQQSSQSPQGKEETYQQEHEKRQRRHYITRKDPNEEVINDVDTFGLGSFRRLSARQVKLKLRSEVSSAGGSSSFGINGGIGSSGVGFGNINGGNGLAGNGDGRRKDEDEELTPLRRMCEGLVEIACFWSDTAKSDDEKDMITHIFDIAREIYTRPSSMTDDEWMRDDVEEVIEELQKSESYLKMLVDRPRHSKSSESTISRLKSLSKMLTGHVRSVDSASEGCAAFMKELSSSSRDKASDVKEELRTAKIDYRIYRPQSDKNDDNYSSSSDENGTDCDEDEQKEVVMKGRRGRRPKVIKNPLEQKHETLIKQLRKNKIELGKREDEKAELERRMEKGPRVYKEDIEESDKEMAALNKAVAVLSETSDQFEYFKKLLISYIELQDKYTTDFERQYKNKERHLRIKERIYQGVPKGDSHLVAIYHPKCLDHRVPLGDSWSSERLERIIDVINKMSAKEIKVHDHPNEAHQFFIGKVHSIDYIRQLVSTAPKDINCKPVPLYSIANRNYAMPYLSAYSLKAATLSAGTVFEAVNQIVSGEAQIAFCVTLPDGNLVGYDKTYGTGFLNDVGIGIEYLNSLMGSVNIAIVDLDALQGCGTIELFEGRDKISVVSVQVGNPFMEVIDTKNIRNVWVPRGCSGEEWLGVINDSVAKWLEAFNPSWVFINMGFNGLASDPLHFMNLTAEDYAKGVDIIASTVPGANIVSVLGGGYAPLDDLGAAVEQHILTLVKHLKAPSPPKKDLECPPFITTALDTSTFLDTNFDPNNLPRVDPPVFKVKMEEPIKEQ